MDFESIASAIPPLRLAYLLYHIVALIASIFFVTKGALSSSQVARKNHRMQCTKEKVAHGRIVRNTKKIPLEKCRRRLNQVIVPFLGESWNGTFLFDLPSRAYLS